SVIERINQNLAKLRGGAHDFTVLRQEETVQATSGVVRNLTALVAVIGAVTLVVGGVGIMNVMLVSVTERTHEIGVRKAVGATNRQIMQQFMVESMLLCTIGSVIGCLIALAAGILLYLFTDLTPVISWPVVVVAILAALVSGILFGVLPALKAARKDPIEALRNGQ